MHQLEQQAAEAVGEAMARTLERARVTTTRALQQAQAEAEALATDRAGWRLKLLREPVPLASPQSSAQGGAAAAAAAPPPPTAAAAAAGDSTAGAAEEAARRQLSRRRDELQLHVDEYGRAYEEEFGAPRLLATSVTHLLHPAASAYRAARLPSPSDRYMLHGYHPYQASLRPARSFRTQSCAWRRRPHG